MGQTMSKPFSEGWDCMECGENFRWTKESWRLAVPFGDNGMLRDTGPLCEPCAKALDEVSKREWIVELEAGVWIAPWGGDPGRTTVESSAKRFKDQAAAYIALANARLWRGRPFAGARVTKWNA
jgi:hypothetical protein